MSELATIASERSDRRLVVRITGEVDISNAEELGTEIENAVPTDAAVVVVDLSGTRYLDSSGVALLIRLSDRLRARRIEFRVLVPEGAPIRGVLELTGLASIMPLDS